MRGPKGRSSSNEEAESSHLPHLSSQDHVDFTVEAFGWGAAQIQTCSHTNAIVNRTERRHGLALSVLDANSTGSEALAPFYCTKPQKT